MTSVEDSVPVMPAADIPKEATGKLPAFEGRKEVRFSRDQAPKGTLHKRKRDNTSALTVLYSTEGPQGSTLLYVKGKLKSHRITILID